MDISSDTEYDSSSPSGRSIRCSNCTKENRVFSQGDHEIFVCQHCGGVFGRNGEFRTVKMKKKKTILEHEYRCLPMGTPFSYEGIHYTIVGVVIKHELGDKIRWTEYSLRSESGDYACLAEYCGHTTFVIPIKSQIGQTSDTVRVYQTTFTHYHKYSIHIDSLYGAFNYDVLKDEEKDYREYIAPPFVIIRESGNSQNEFYLGKYLYRHQLKRCLPKPMSHISAPYSSYHVRPHRLDWNGSFIFRGFVIVMLLLFFVHFFVWSPQGDYLIQSQRVPAIIRDVELPSFTLTAPHSVLRVDASSAANQSWIEGEITLIDHQTGEQRTGVVVSEYYSGTDSDGSWVENNSQSELYFENLTQGEYHLEVTTESGGTSEPLFLSVNVSRSHWRNAFISMLMCIGMMVIIYYTAFYTPSKQEESSDD